MATEAEVFFMVMNVIEHGMNETAEEANEIDGTNIGQTCLSSHQPHTYCEGIEALKDRTQVVTRIGSDPARDVLSASNNEGKEGVGVVGCTWQPVLNSHPLPVITPSEIRCNKFRVLMFPGMKDLNHET